MEPSRFPLLYRLLAILSNIVLDFLLFHERGEDGLIDGIICNPGEQRMREGEKTQFTYHRQ